MMRVHPPTPGIPRFARPLCPHCGGHRIYIQASVQIDYEVALDGDLEDLHVLSDLIGDAMWDENSHASCPSCDWSGYVGDLLASPDDQTPTDKAVRS